jgi:translocation protein SEC63
MTRRSSKVSFKLRLGWCFKPQSFPHPEQAKLLLQAPMLLNALLAISAARSWLSPTLMVMRLHAYIMQALLPGKPVPLQAQLPGFDMNVDTSGVKGLTSFISRLEDEDDIRVPEARKALEGWSRLDVVDMSFRG